MMLREITRAIGTSCRRRGIGMGEKLDDHTPRRAWMYALARICRGGMQDGTEEAVSNRPIRTPAHDLRRQPERMAKCRLRGGLAFTNPRDPMVLVVWNGLRVVHRNAAGRKGERSAGL
jgi:hypothetical protein